MTHPAHRARALLATTLAGLVTATSAPAQTTDAETVRRLQEENAALRKRLADLGVQVPAPPPAATPTAPAPRAPAATSRTATGPTLTTDEGVQALTPFEVKTDKDYGYLKTNAATATRIGTEIQKIPMTVSVVSREFLDDTNARSLTDLLRYSATGSGDTRFAMRRPANEATPQGTFTQRGFTVNTLLRNSQLRYFAYNLDNVERVEIVEGPAAVFFGQGYPGGVINYITKKPSFAQIPTTFRYTMNDNSGQKLVIDSNNILTRTTAFRVVGAWEDSQGERRFEFRKNVNITPSLTYLPFENGKVKINVEAEYLREKLNQNDYDWIFPNQWFVDYATPPAALIAAAGLSTNADPVAAYRARIRNNIGAWQADRRTAANDQGLPLFTQVKRGALVTGMNGRYRDEAFNFTSRGAYTENEVKTFETTVDMSPFSWLDARYSYTKEHSFYDSVEGLTTPYADAIYWNVGASSTAGYYRQQDSHQIDLIFKGDFFRMKHKVLTGFYRSNWVQQYNANYAGGQLAPYLGTLPGATNPVANPGFSFAAQPIAGSSGQVPVNQVIRDRNGQIKTINTIYTNWDPGFEVNPDISRVLPLDRPLLDGYKPKLNAAYINYQLSAMDDRLNILGGFRQERRKDTGQHLVANFPWFIVGNTDYLNPAQYPEDVYSYSVSYSRTNWEKSRGNSWMGGASFAFTKAITGYASVSKTFKFNFGNVGGFFPGDEVLWAQAAIAQGGGSFQYRGQTIRSAQDLQNAMTATGAFNQVKHEEGMNYEIGAKVSSPDSKVVGTLALFRGERENQRLDDSPRQQNAEEPLNFSTTLFPVGSPFYNTRLLRWRTTDLKNRIEGASAEVFWTPRRNFQAVINGSWMWTAKTLDDKTRPKPGTALYNAASAATRMGTDIYYAARIENVPEFRLNVFNKYTFDDNLVGDFGRGASVSVGMRYSSETVVSRSADWNPLRGGYQAGDYVVWDLVLGYPWKVFGASIHSSLGVYNVTDEKYSEGSFALSPARNWVFSNTFKF